MLFYKKRLHTKSQPFRDPEKEVSSSFSSARAVILSYILLFVFEFRIFVPKKKPRRLPWRKTRTQKNQQYRKPVCVCECVSCFALPGFSNIIVIIIRHRNDFTFFKPAFNRAAALLFSFRISWRSFFVCLVASQQKCLFASIIVHCTHTHIHTYSFPFHGITPRYDSQITC